MREMTADSVQVVHGRGFSSINEMRNGFQEQTEILCQLSKQLDEYFMLRSFEFPAIRE